MGIVYDNSLLLSRRSRQRKLLHAMGVSICLSVCLFVCLSPNCKNAIFSRTKLFRPMVSIGDLQEVAHGLFKEPIIGPLKSKMAEIRHLENRHDVIFLLRLSGLDKILLTGAEWHVDCGDMVKIETRCRIPIWRTFGRIPWHVIPEPRITLQGAATWWIHRHDSRATCYIAGCSHLAKSMSWSCHIAGCNNSIRHIENRFSPYFVFLFLVQFGLWRAAAIVSSPIHLLLSKFVQKSTHTETRRPTKEKQQQLYTVFIKETATFFVHNSEKK